VSSLDWLDLESFEDGENGDTKGVLLHGDCDYALTVTHMATLSSRHNRARLHTRRSPSLAEENQELSLVLLDKA
jgi:hypothetical protein